MKSQINLIIVSALTILITGCCCLEQNSGGLKYIDLASPPGVVVAYAGNTIPVGWLLCNGATIKREEYRRLFDQIREIYGKGDGVSTFQLPDYQGRFLRGLDVEGKNVKEEKGRTVGMYQEDAFKTHTHKYDTATAKNGPKWPDISQQGGQDDGSWRNPTVRADTSKAIVEDDKDVNGSETRPKNMTVNWIIKY